MTAAISGVDALTAALAATRRSQTLAADPAASAWVSANAGTGKTHVLIQRVLRLLLAGTAPERILCLTYTKAAAAEMSNRLFVRLSSWATMPANDLDLALADVLDRRPEPQERARSRTLFAMTIETPGGLKVQTIHAFCERVLQRFPIEAGIAAKFSVLDDEERRSLIADATRAVLRDAMQAPDLAIGQALSRVIRHASDQRFDELLAIAVERREDIRDLIQTADASDDPFEDIATGLRRALGLDPGASVADLEAHLAKLIDPAEARRFAEVLSTGTANDQKAARRLEAIVAARATEPMIAALADLFRTQRGDPRGALMTKKLAAAQPQTAAALAESGDRFAGLYRALQSARLCEASIALLRLADAAIQYFTDAKSARGALDFHDLIEHTRALLATALDAQWVLFKLDGSLEHILVDEAQDTSPRQWDIVTTLASEFFAGAGARDAPRTVFAVGDEKQSIYSFQGARPERFAATGRTFAAQAVAVQRPLNRLPLDLSFRSATPILEAVDRVFADHQRTPGLSADLSAIQHSVARAGHAGLVEIWPTEKAEPLQPSQTWEPLDDSRRSEPMRRLADRITGTIGGWLATREILTSEGRPIRAGDVLILVRKRAPFAPLIVRSLKARGIPVAGADRLNVTDQIAVEDLVALGSFVLLPEDDLALASVLKSPLIGLTDDDLYTIGYRRRGALWTSLLTHAEQQGTYRGAAEALKRWRSRADFLPPFEFYASLLERDGVRGRMLARLGPEAGDAVDAFLNLALSFDAMAPPSLQGFLDWLGHAEPEIRRDMEQGRDEVRVMTVHGAKGLEAPIVILPDTCSTRDANRGGGFLGLPSTRGPSPLVWLTSDAHQAEAVKTAKAAEALSRRQEYHRLLYVALTRPRDRLYVCGYEGRTGRDSGCWYDLVAQALDGQMQRVPQADGSIVLRLESPQTAEPKPSPAAVVDGRGSFALPDWASRPAPRQEVRAIPLAPSRLAPLASEDDPPSAPNAHAEPPAMAPRALAQQDRFRRGLLSHTLLQHLPDVAPKGRRTAGKRYLDRVAADISTPARTGLLREVLAVLDHPGFEALFGPGSLAEVPIAAEIALPSKPGVPLRVTGQIDRLALTEQEVLIVDFKTNRPPPVEESGVAQAYLLQLAAYRLVLRQIYPGRAVRAALLWTDGPRLMPVSDHILDIAEREILAGGPWP